MDRLLVLAAALALGACSSSGAPSSIDAAGDAPPGTGPDARDAGVNCACGRGAYVPTCGVDGKTYDAACGLSCVPVKIACSGQCPCAAGAPRPCQVNSDCDPGQVCYAGLSSTCQASTVGTCVARLTAPCQMSLGSGCPCIDVSAGACSANSGGYCYGADSPNECWICHLPV